MKRFNSRICLVVITLFCFTLPQHQSRAVTLQFVGSQANLGGTFFPGGSLPYVTVPWRTSSSANIYATGSEYPEQFYGKDGYALFATTFSYPNANFVPGDANIVTDGSDPLFPNVIDLPSWVADSQILSTRMAGGFAYSLIDDPVLMNDGTRQWSFDGVNYPQAAAGNNTGQNPWVKMGFLDGTDILGNLPEDTPTGRWGFTVGEEPPAAFRVGVMTGGMDAERFAPTEVFLQQYDNSGAIPVPVGDPVQTGTLSGELKDRFVDMHFFDIVNAQAGDTFVFAATAAPNTGAGTGAGIAGFSFDVLPDVIQQPGDFNGDNRVDGADFLFWQRMPEVGSLSDWQDNYGNSAESSLVSVPEPDALVMLCCLIAFCSVKQRCL